MSEEARLIVAKVDIDRWEEQEHEMVPGSSIDTCRVCEDSVWVSPEGHQFVYVDNPDESTIVCVDCHIRLEIERRKEDENAKPIPTVQVPGASPPLPEHLRQAWIRDTEQEIKEGLEGGT